MRKLTIKKLLILSLLLLFFLQLAAAEETKWGSNYKPGNLILGITGAFETEVTAPTGTALGLYPGAEIILWKPTFGKIAPMDFGLGVTGRAGIPLNEDSGFSLGAAFIGSMHIGFRGFDIPYSEYLDNLELYAHFGISYDFIHEDGGQLGTVATSGVNYFLDENLNLGISYTGWGNGETGYDGVGIHVRYRMGDRPEVQGMSGVWETYQKGITALESMGPVSQFYALFYYSVYSGGYYWNSQSYDEGTGTAWIYSSEDGESFHVERTMLQRTAEGDWWSLLFYTDSEKVEYEFFLSNEQELSEMYYTDSHGQAQKHIFSNSPELGYMTEEAVIEFQEMESMSNKRENVTVPAGLYRDCLLVEITVENQQNQWWFSDSNEVPGHMVKFYSEDGSDILTGELERIIAGRIQDFRLKD